MNTHTPLPQGGVKACADYLRSLVWDGTLPVPLEPITEIIQTDANLALAVEVSATERRVWLDARGPQDIQLRLPAECSTTNTRLWTAWSIGMLTLGHSVPSVGQARFAPEPEAAPCIRAASRFAAELLVPRAELVQALERETVPSLESLFLVPSEVLAYQMADAGLSSIVR
ncbi:ImmA/IrrE family metallo-endopeptidase [Thioalkalivibrio sp. ALE19]|uniref:ImmA/IrrE family metallo-endopeptidase n=1 Tax=Thioalkalivibrio sp. ALE19 TaxID=1266909 RepID=UPI00048ED18C|nr:hypothetical protein [Thioalkalivibrio sp. ALE19]